MRTSPHPRVSRIAWPSESLFPRSLLGPASGGVHYFGAHMISENWAPPIAIAHRGSRELWPENTMEAFTQAVALGFRFLETDLHVTADGVLGAPASAPFDRIIATASAREIPPAWIAQLRPGGRLVLPFRLNHCQVIVALDRAGQDLVSVSSVAGGAFMPLRSDGLDPVVVALPDGARATADVPLDDVLLASVVEHGRDARPVTLPVPDGERGYAAFVFVALQGAPIYAIERWAGESLVAESRVLVTSAQSALRWPLVPRGEEPEVLGSDEALDFVRAALMRWRLAGEPGVERLRMRVTLAGGAGVLNALPRPISGAYRFARGAHAYELRFATA
ncbi:MAG: glycerophosphodiester phosphodiesterase family protein [Dehalococcoidia bacterium]